MSLPKLPENMVFFNKDQSPHPLGGCRTCDHAISPTQCELVDTVNVNSPKAGCMAFIPKPLLPLPKIPLPLGNVGNSIGTGAPRRKLIETEREPIKAMGDANPLWTNSPHKNVF